MKKRKIDPRRNDMRNKEILKRAQSGERLVDIALDYGITGNRVGQIVQREKRFYPTLLLSDNPIA